MYGPLKKVSTLAKYMHDKINADKYIIYRWKDQIIDKGLLRAQLFADQILKTDLLKTRRNKLKVKLYSVRERLIL